MSVNTVFANILLFLPLVWSYLLEGWIDAKPSYKTFNLNVVINLCRRSLHCVTVLWDEGREYGKSWMKRVVKEKTERRKPDKESAQAGEWKINIRKKKS